MATRPSLPDYEVHTLLATGGMAEIFAARGRSGPVAGKDVVLKRLLPSHRDDTAYVELFLAEARLGAMVGHPNIVHTYDVFRRGRDYYLVQELVGGDTLGRLCLEARAAGDRLDIDAGLVAVVDLLLALDHLHRGAPTVEGPRTANGAAIVHRDVNPDNLVATPEGVAKLIDFGIAEVAGTSLAGERSGALRGTPAYMSPEQVKSRALDARSDLFSAGIVLWEMLANRTLFAQKNEFETLRHVAEVPATPLALVDASLPKPFERVCVRALARERDRRFQSASEFLDALRDAALRSGFPLDRAHLAREVKRLGRRAPILSK